MSQALERTDVRANAHAALQVSPALADLLSKSLSPNTYSTYRTALERLRLWLAGRELNDATLAEHVAYLHGQGFAPSTISIAVAAASRIATANGIESPKGALTTEALMSVRREGRSRGRGQSDALTYDGLVAILSTCSLPVEHERKIETPAQARKRGLVDAAIASLLFMAGMRRSEVAALTWDCIADAEGGNVLVQVKESKTNKEGELDLRLLKNGAAKALRDLRDVRQAEGRANPDAPVIGLSSKSINRRFQNACEVAGISGRLTAHSGRIGLASELVTRGASIGAVALAGGWKSDKMALHYAKRARVEQGAVATYF